MLCNTGAHKVPDSTAHQSRMTTDNGPILIQSTTGITSYRQVLVHERRARVLRFGHHRRVHLQLIGCRVARTYNLLTGMGVGVAAIHKIACGVESLTQRSLATLVARTPEEHAGVVTVAQHQFLHTFQVHLAETLVIRDILRGMSLCARLVNDVEAILVGQFQILIDRRIVRRTHSVEVVLLQYLHIAANGLLVHGVSQFGVLHMAVGGIHLDGLAVQIERLVPYLRLLEAHLARNLLHHVARLAEQFQLQVVEHGRLAGPLVGIGNER